MRAWTSVRELVGDPVDAGRAPASSARREQAVRGRRLDPWLAAAIGATIAALALRVTGVGYGLPAHFHWDEPTIMNRAIRMGNGDLNPHFFYYPSLLIYVMLAVNGALYAVGRVLHLYASTNDFAISYLIDSTSSYVAGRALMAALGAATVLLVFEVGRRFLSAPAGLIGAVLLAVSPIHIGNSHFVATDVPMAFLAMVGYLFIWQVYTRGRTRDYVLAGVAVGLGVSTKYLPLVLLVTLALAHVFRLRNETGTWRSFHIGLSRLMVAAAAAFAAFALTSPFVLLDWRTAVRDYRAQAAFSSATGCQSCGLNFAPYLTHTLGWSIGWAAYILALTGLASLVWKRGEPRLRGVLLASFPILVFLVVGSERQSFPRYLVPLAPFACLAAGGALLGVAQWLTAKLAVARILPRGNGLRPAAYAIAGLLALAAAAQPALDSARFDQSLLTNDPRSQAAAWFEGNVPDGTTVAVQPLLDRYFLTAQLHTDATLADVLSYLPPNKAGLRDILAERYHEHPVYHEATFVYDLARLRSEGVRFVVISSAHYHSVGDSNEDRLYADLAVQARLAARFAPPVNVPEAEMYPTSMPTITVYELEPAT